jgi:DNA replication protein DnaC
MSLIDNLNISVNTQPDDYTENGLIHCGKCKTPKQADVFGTLRPIMCECEQIAYKQAAEDKANRIRQERITDRLKSSGIPTKYIGKTLQNIDKTVQISGSVDVCQDYLDNWQKNKADGKGLFLYGSTGTGKTMLACIIGQELIKRGIAVKFISVYDILRRPQGFEYAEANEAFDEMVKTISLLIIDDLGVERTTPYAKEQVTAVLDMRYGSGLPMIVTSNLSNEELKTTKDMADGRIKSRITELKAVQMNGQDYRRTIAKRKD